MSYNIEKENKNIDLFISLTEDILQNELFRGMTQYEHHGTTDTHFHSVYVAYTAMKVCEKIGADTEYIVRTSLLHDFYLYDWHIEKHEEYHAWYHPKAAVRNIRKYNVIPLDKKQEDMILRHMFPLAKAPNSLGGWVLTLSDKRCATADYIKTSKKFIPVYNEINRRVEAL
ncbi:MAG: HDIG domain-containing protein [Eubacterium sp.]|nr:HDIG domain-containing protein [Eubacterium sp.]